MRQIVRTTEELDEMPVGSVVMTLWERLPYAHMVMARYTNGWFGYPAQHALYPFGARANGRAVLVLWNPDVDEEPE